MSCLISRLNCGSFILSKFLISILENTKFQLNISPTRIGLKEHALIFFYKEIKLKLMDKQTENKLDKEIKIQKSDFSTSLAPY